MMNIATKKNIIIPSVYFTDANNMQGILNGKRQTFLNSSLQIDKSIELKKILFCL
ncbi:MAG: hypothetical protein R2836_00220 [Chitinophagales bacterium]